MFRSLEVWTESVSLIKKIYVLADKLPKEEEYNLKSQLKRAVTAVALNIAEGKSRATAKDFANFLNTASGSLSEVLAILVLCDELKFIQLDNNLGNEIITLNKRIKALRNNLTQTDKQ